ncbi:MAG: hypothetical protein KC457_17545 [Myxococcales bacterium]|nr:hypothetical protein [Myxococcales bacterium]
MFRPLHTLTSLVLLALGLWAAFAVDLGGKTFAEHIDTISETPEAQELLDGARSRINPALHDVRDRVLGEYVEAPTWIAPTGQAGQAAPEREPSELDEGVPAATLEPRRPGEEPGLPGRRRRSASSFSPPAKQPPSEVELAGSRSFGEEAGAPPLPGHRGPREEGPSEPVYARP